MHDLAPPPAPQEPAGLTPTPEWVRTWATSRPGVGKAVHPAPEGRPAWLPVLPAFRRISERGSAEELPPIEDVAAALAAVPNPAKARGWDDWNRIMMAAYAASGGSAAGLALAQAWSARSSKYDPDETAARWEHFGRSPPIRIGYGTLVHEARLAAGKDWVPPSTNQERHGSFTGGGSASPEVTGGSQKVDPATAGQVNPATGGVNGHHALPLALTRKKANNPLIELNERYSVIGDVGGKCLVLSWVPSKIDRTLKVPSFQSFKSFAERYGNAYVMVGDEAKPLGAHWLRWPGRESFEGIDLIPGGEPVSEGRVLNLWAGFGVEPRPAPAGWPLMRRHICEVLAAGDPAGAEYILKFAAWCVQHPGERAEVALVFRGGKGSGKGTFANAMVRIFGAHGLQVFNSKHLVGAFNGHLRNCLLLFADEAFWAGDKQGESVLKGMLTERALVIEQKGVDAVLWENRLHVIMAANAEWVVPASHDERRFAMFDVSPVRVGDRGYFDALHNELTRDRGLGAMLYDLLRVDLKGWHPREILHGEALRAQKERSLDLLHEWWEEILQNGTLPFSSKYPADAGQAQAGSARASGLVAAGTMFHIFQEMAGANRGRNVSSTGLGRFLRTMGLRREHKTDGNYWGLAPLAECRAGWEAKFGGWSWREDLASWV